MVVAVTLPSGQPWAVPVRIEHRDLAYLNGIP